MRLVRTCVAIGNDSQKQWWMEARAKQEGWIGTKETTQQGVHLNGQAAFRVLERLVQPYESPKLLHGCTFISLNLHTVAL